MLPATLPVYLLDGSAFDVELEGRKPSNSVPLRSPILRLKAGDAARLMETSVSKKRRGYVYLKRRTQEDEVRYKIGYSERPQPPASNTARPGAAELVDQFFHDQAATLARRIRRRFSDRRIGRSQWFSLTDRDAESFSQTVREECRFLSPKTAEPDRHEPPAPRIVARKKSTGFRVVIADGKNDYDPVELPDAAISAIVKVLVAAAKKRGELPASDPPGQTAESSDTDAEGRQPGRDRPGRREDDETPDG